jgi:hypothetical protein
MAGDSHEESVRTSSAVVNREESIVSGENEKEQNNVGALITKSKKVASSLFTLLHAKVRSVFSFFLKLFSSILIFVFHPNRTVGWASIDVLIRGAPMQNSSIYTSKLARQQRVPHVQTIEKDV